MAIENLSLSAGQSALLAATKGGQPLADGQVLEARVTAVLENGSVRLQTLLGLLEAVPQTPLKPGATLFLEVQRQGDSLRLVPTERPPTAATGQGQGGAGAAPQPASGLDRPAVLTGGAVAATARPAAPAPATPGTAPAAGSSEAGTVRGPAAASGGGTAPAAAPTSTGAGAPSTAGIAPGGGPAPAAAPAQPAGGTALPAQGGAPQAANVPTPAGQTGPGGGAAPAAATGGQTSAATGAATAATPAGASATAAATAPATPRAAAPAAEMASRPPLADTLKAAVQAAMRGDVARQGSMAALYADLSALVAGRGQRLPEPVMRAAAALLGFRLDSAEAPSGEALKSALARSGVFLEARLADGKAPAQGDLKASLGTLKSALLTFLGDMAEEGLATRGETLPPPRRGAAPLAQRAGAPTLPLDADGPAMAR
ncbi:MAG TPA: hypothetical protein PLG99_05870, partial [Kaistiaceae bacterium]|nr:hypothetical protein [Kaistiaceae bacterium]